MRTVVAATLVAISVSATGSVERRDPAGGATRDQERRVVASYGELPLSFEPNLGQFDAAARYLARARGYSLFLGATEARLSLGSADNAQAAVRLSLVGADAAAPSSALEPLPGRVNHLVGNPASWRTDVPTYGRVSTAGVYPGIDVVWYGHQGELEYDFVVAPGADPNRVRLAIDGVHELRLDDNGDLLLDAGAGQLLQRAPVTYQQTAGRRTVIPSHYVLDGNQVSFSIGAYDPARPLVIDPVLSYSTFLGGSSLSGDSTSAIDVDSSGSAYLVGTAHSTDYPTTVGAFQATKAGGNRDVFVTKLNPTGTALVYSTYLGGGDNEIGNAISVDSSGNAYITGSTLSADFPMKNPIDGTLGSPGSFSEDAFVTKLNPTGSALVYSSYLGGGHSDNGRGIDVDSSGNAYLTGGTGSTDFPSVSAAQPTKSTGFDAFVTKVNAAGSALTYSTFLGGIGGEEGARIAVDGSGSAYLTGTTNSSNFPTHNARQPQFGGGTSDAFVTKLAATGSALAWSTYHGGNGQDVGQDVSLDSAGSAYVASSTRSTNFPTLNPLQAAIGGEVDATVSKLSSTGSLVYSTYLGGSGFDQAYGVAVDASGHAYVAGNTFQGDFPIVNAIQPQRRDSDEAFVARLNPAGSGLDYSTYLGGTAGDVVYDVAADPSGNAYLTGGTGSQFPDDGFNVPFPTTPGAFQTRGAQSFVTKIAPDPPRSRPPADFDGNGTTDVAVFRPGSGTWYLRTASPAAVAWGQNGDIPVPGDYNGDRITDIAVFRPSNNAWYIRTPTPQFVLWGEAGDIPVPGDYDGNGTTDIAIFRPSTGTWFLRTASPTAVAWGQAGDIPVPGDYDGNGITDIAVFRPGNNAWYIRTPTPQFVLWGETGDIPVPGDYDGNGTTDVAIFRPATGTWYLRTVSPFAVVWGQSGDVPAPGDYDGNGTTDIAVFRPASSSWYIRTPTPQFVAWGETGDKALSLPDAIRRFF